MKTKFYEAPACEAGGFNNTTGTEGYRYYEDRRSRGKSVRLVRDAF